MVDAWHCSIKDVLESFRNGFDANNNSPERSFDIFSDFYIGTGESKAGFLLDFNLCRTKNRWFIMRATIILIRSDKDKTFQILWVGEHAGFECKLI